MSISLPETLGAPDTKVYVSSVMANPGIAMISIALDGYSNTNGSPVIATATIESPDAFRLYQLSAMVPGVYGFVVFGSACQEGRAAVSDYYTAETGALLTSVVTRYPVVDQTLFTVDNTQIADAVQMVASGGLVIEVVPVYFMDTDETKPALNFRLARNSETMRAPVAACDMPAEVANRPDIVTSVNGVRPDSSGALYLRLKSEPDFRYDNQGYILTDPETGLPKLSGVRPLVTFVDGGSDELVIKDNFDHRVTCSGKRATAAVTAAVVPGGCSNCSLPAESPTGGADLYDGVPISMAGAVIWRDLLVLYWTFLAQGTPKAGINPLLIVITNPEENPPLDPATGEELPPLQVVGVRAIKGIPPRFPSNLLPGLLKPIVAGTLGEPVYSVYQLNRWAIADEPFSISLPAPSVVMNQPPPLPVGYPVYHSAPKVDKCIRRARDPYSIPTPEFTDL
jgi:hypothetical protein